MQTESAKQIRQSLSTGPLPAVDRCLEALSTAEDASTRDQLLSVFIEAVLRSKDQSFDKGHLHDALFKKEIPTNTRRFIAVCLLRLLAVNEHCISDDLRYRAVVLFDEVLPDIYKRLHLEHRSQTHEKVNKLLDYLREAENAPQEVLSGLNRIDNVPSLRRAFTRSLRSDSSKLVIAPFLGSDPVVDRIDDAFGLVMEYQSASVSRILDAYKDACDSLERLQLEAESVGTQYSRLLVAGMARRLLELVIEHFAANPLTKPAELIVRESEKKYPLHAAGHDFTFTLIVENTGEGYAQDVRLTVSAFNVRFQEREHHRASLEPREPNIVALEATVLNAAPYDCIEVLAEWTDFDGRQRESSFLLEAKSQQNIEWSALEDQHPYSIEPVTDQEKLIGRDSVVKDLINQMRNFPVGSCLIDGQKRVGKTSIVKTLKTHLESMWPEVFTVIYIEAGDYSTPDAASTVSALGQTLALAVQDSDDRLSQLEIPVFKDALSPLSPFLTRANRLAPERRFVFILDEFDELPVDLYKSSTTAGAFFSALRTISGKEFCGIILVGGERMQYVVANQGYQLNKFGRHTIDYFDKQQHWADFQALVRRPVAPHLEIADSAVSTLYEETSGHPFFTTLVCRTMFPMMVERRDTHVTDREITDAVERTLKVMSLTSVQHFWDDGLLEVGAEREEMAMKRKKLLIAVTHAMKDDGQAQKIAILERATGELRMQRGEAEDLLRSFVGRRVLTANPTDTYYTYKMPLVGKWLKKGGASQISTEFIDRDAVDARKAMERDSAIRSVEIMELVSKWPCYRGQRITEDRVRAWLGQFGGNIEQRLIWPLLTSLRFYSNGQIREKMREAHGIVSRDVPWERSGRRSGEGIGRQQRRRDILVSYLDGPGKSGSAYARFYAEENGIYMANVVEKSQLPKVLTERTDVRALVLLDDFVGTGNSVAQNWAELAAELREAPPIPAFFVAVCGFERGRGEIDRRTSDLQLCPKICFCESLDDSARAFHERSATYPDSDERSRAQDLVERFGRHLQKRDPLGYGNCQAAVVFEDTCPNNSLPVFWSSADAPVPWRALFPRI